MYELQLKDPAEREWLTNVDPTEIRDNAHRVYDWMHQQGVAEDSYLRELAFSKASTELGIPYDRLYTAWLMQEPVPPAAP